MERSTEKPDRNVRRRQDPVSCRLCRIKKLKCNRQHPCSNCVARQSTCEFEPNQATTTARIKQDAEPSNAAILSRLQRLEDMIMRMNQHPPATPDTSSPRNAESDANGPSLLTPAEESHQLEAQTLNSIGTQQPSLFPAASGSFVFDTVPLEYISKHESSVLDAAPHPIRQKRIILPTYNDARTMFDRYAKYISHYHHVIHLPTLRKILENLYLRLSRKEVVDTDHAALLLSIFAAVICYEKMSEPDSVPLEQGEDNNNVFLLWFRSTLDLLDHSRRVLPASVEIVQTAVIILFLDYNLEGFTSRARAVLAQGLHSAKELSMHKLDCPNATRRREASTSIDSMVELEMKRRIWWHLVATDWMVSLAGSSQEGTYTAHPQQMRVRLPRNIDDEVLDRGNTTEDLPLTQPTPMSYPLQRIRLGELSRSVVDTLRFGISDVGEHEYAHVMVLDKRIQHFLEDLPVFLKLDAESLQKSQYILERYPYFAMQRYIINIGAQSIRCKLHQPFLVRSHDKAKYSQSIEICLSSAMKVIEINKAVRDDPTRYIPEKVKCTGLLHHMFLATVVLVMDLCFNRLNGTEDHRSSDVAYAISMLEEAKGQSISVQRFLDSLTEALKKHHVRLVADPATAVDGLRQNPISSLNPQIWQTGSIIHGGFQAPQSAITNNGANNMPFTTIAIDDAWKDAIDQSDMTTLPDWDQLFSELDAFIA